jgi:hypothetical protein
VKKTSNIQLEVSEEIEIKPKKKMIVKKVNV